MKTLILLALSALCAAGATHTNDGWRFFSASGNIGVGDGGGQMRLIVYLGEGGSALIDDLSIVAGTNAGVGFNYVRNGDFELPLYENPLVTNSWNVGTNYTNSLIVSDLVHAGSGALKMIGTTPGSTGIPPSFPRLIYQLLSPAPLINSINTLSFWYWATNSATNLYVRIRNTPALTTGPGGTNINITHTNDPGDPGADPLIAALDDPTLAWFNTGWVPVTTPTHDGIDGAEGSAPHSGVALLQTTATGPGTLSFWWNVSSQAGSDFLSFDIDSVGQPPSISGSPGWQKRIISIPPGTHVFRWRYIKDGRVASGLDRAYLDDVVFTPLISITAQPANQAVLSGATATFIVSATTTNPPLSYQWQFNGANLQHATNESLVVSNVSLAEAGAYRVILTDAAGAASATLGADAFLSLVDASAPSVTTLAPTNLVFRNALLSGTANPNGSLTTAFFEFGFTTNYGFSTTATNIGSAPGDVTVRLAVTNLVRNTTYYCRMVAYNSSGTNSGERVSFTTPNSAGPVAVLGAPQDATWNDDVRTKLLGSGLFDVVDTFLISTGSPVPTLTALNSYSSVLVFAGGVKYGDGTALGNVLADYLEEGGGVVIAAQGFENMAGRFLSAGYMPFTPGVFPPPSSFLTLVKVLPDHPLLDGVNSFNGGSSSYHNAQILTSNATLVATWSSGTPLIAAKEIGAVRVAGLNFMPVSGSVPGLGSQFWQTNTDGARLMANALSWLQRAPIITQQPTNQFVFAGSDATFSVSAITANPPLRYQWLFNGTNISGAANDSFTVTNAQPADQGGYSVQVRDAVASSFSTVAMLTILSPSITVFAFAKQGGQFSLSVVTVSGAIYYLERKTSLSESNWTPVATAPGNGLVRSLADLSATNSQSFYRVRIE